MTKNGRRALFLLVATALNMLLTIIIVVAVLVLWSLIATWFNISQASAVPVTLVAFLAGVILSGFAYSRAIKALRKRPDLEERFGLVK
jgi:membrane protein implicated in regulation of membrane protease activity